MTKRNNRAGRLIMHNIILERQEYKTISFFLELGKDIELIPPSHTPKTRTPDFFMDGVAWEMKSPQGKNCTTIERALHRAVRQSRYIILDLRRMQLSDEKMYSYIEKHFTLTRSIKKLKIILKSGKIVDFYR